MGSQVLQEPTLVLNKHWAPVRVCSVRRALTLVFKDVARILEPERVMLHDFTSWADLKVARGAPFVQSVSLRIRIPEVIVLHRSERYMKPRVVFSRRNIFRRDKNTCQYCGTQHATEDLSIDHVIPRSLGGRSSWTNCVVACLRCNSRKGNRTLEAAHMQILRIPREPPPHMAFTLHVTTRKASWEQFVSDAYWDVELAE